MFVFEDTLKHEVLYSLFQLKLVPSSRAVKIFVLMISSLLQHYTRSSACDLFSLRWHVWHRCEWQSLVFSFCSFWHETSILWVSWAKAIRVPVFQLSRERALFSAVAAQDRTSATQGYKGVGCNEKCQQLAPTGVKEDSHLGSSWGRESHLLDCTWPGQNFCNTGLMCVISKSWFTCHRHSLVLLTFSRVSSTHISSFVVRP